MNVPSKIFIYWLLLCVAVVVVFVLQLCVGSYPIAITELIHAAPGTVAATILYQSRMPAAIAATLGGIALSVSGLQMQTYFKNPVAGPFVLGISSGASLGVAVLIMLSGMLDLQEVNEWGIVAASSIGAVGVFMLVMLLSYRLHSSASMLIVGLMIASFIGAIVEAIQTVSTADAIKSFLFWTMGSYRVVSPAQIPVMAVVIGVAMLGSIYLIKPLNLLLIGEEHALLSGIALRPTRILVVLCICMLTGAITAFCGPIGFIGLAVPHIARGLFRTSDHRILLPAVVLLGVIISGLCNLLSGLSIHGLVLPVNTITSLLGAPFVIGIVMRGMGKGNRL